jgi:hypothetical protein
VCSSDLPIKQGTQSAMVALMHQVTILYFLLTEKLLLTILSVAVPNWTWLSVAEPNQSIDSRGMLLNQSIHALFLICFTRNRLLSRLVSEDICYCHLIDLVNSIWVNPNRLIDTQIILFAGPIKLGTQFATSVSMRQVTSLSRGHTLLDWEISFWPDYLSQYQINPSIHNQ